MMSPTMQMPAPVAPYTPTSDVMDRHEYGITKNRKTASTGGGRAWSEDEEVYLLQTRLQKMPYKHIAAHLKKTELACRLHYHQLSHGSNRRKRTTSVSSGSSTGGHSPTMLASIPSPIHEHDHDAGTSSSRSTSPPGSAGSYGPTSPNSVQLPSIMHASASTDASPRLPTILPKPASMTLALASATVGGSPTASSSSSRGYPTPLGEHHPHSAPLSGGGSTSYRGSTMTPTSAGLPHHHQQPHPHGPHSHHPHHPHLPGPLRLDCSALPPPQSSASLSAGGGPSSATSSSSSYSALTHSGSASHPVDMARLAAVYAAHRASFWAAVAADYGRCANPVVLEQAWRAGSPALGTSGYGGGGGVTTTSMAPPAAVGVAAHTPITPVGSPDDHVYPAVAGAPAAKGQGGSQDKTRISAILGIDANPRSPKEREMVRRLEEERCSVAVVGA